MQLPGQEKREESIQLAESSILLEKIKLESVCSIKGEPIIHSPDQKLHPTSMHTNDVSPKSIE